MLRKLSFSSLIAMLTSLLMAAVFPLASAGLSASHAPSDGRFEPTASLPASAQPDASAHQHGSSLKGEFEAESQVTHHHTHFAADHLHDLPSAPPEHASMASGPDSAWRPGAQAGGQGTVLAVPERPPRRAVA